MDLSLFFPGITKSEVKDNVWIADSGASTHMYTGDNGFCTTTAINDGVQVG